ncbi:hypothetical protein MMC11_008176 [Xylographa trunciseda]|nr:hypothetical protein [Xylographa trunciseda]
MEVAIRWSPLSIPTEARFLIADVVGRTFKLCHITNYENSNIQWEEVSRISKVPAFRTFDWSPKNDVVAVGQWSGETVVLALGTGRHVLSLPIKSQRQCNAVAFNNESLLATGLERVRNDFCLNIYDINQRVPSQSLQSSTSSLKQTVDPVRKLATSEGITSIKYFAQQPRTLVAGVKGTCVRIYDLREDSTNPSLQYQTTCVHNLAIDPTDENYFASAAPPKETMVMIWDRRSTRRPTSTRTSIGGAQDGPALELKKPVEEGDGAANTNIWRLQYSSTEPGCLGILASSGNFRLYHTKKEYIEEDEPLSKGHIDQPRPIYAQDLYVSHVDAVERSYQRRRLGVRDHDREELDRIVSFDFANVCAPDQRPCAITLRGNGDIGIYELKRRRPALAVSARSAVVVSRPAQISTTADKGDLPSVLVLKEASQFGSIAEALTHIKENASKNESTGESFVISVSLTSNLISCALRNSLMTSDHADWQNMTDGSPSLSISDALVLGEVARRRCIEGYLFDCEKNVMIVRDDLQLQEMWSWIKMAQNKARDGNMVADDVDFGYLGVNAVWNEDLAPQDTRILSRNPREISIASAITSLSQSLGLQDAGLPETSKPEHRLICLYTLGFSAKTGKFFSSVNNLIESGDNLQACLLSLMYDNSDLALKALQSGPRKHEDIHNGLAMAITAFSLIQETKLQGERRKLALSRIQDALNTTDEPHTQAIAAYVTSGDWTTVIQTPSVPLRYRLGIAIRTLSDTSLSAFLIHETSQAILSGAPQSLPLTGLTIPTLSLFQSYLNRASDLQSAVLAMSFAAPRFVRDPRFDTWRAAYRAQLNTWKLFIERTYFDTQSTKLSVTWDGTKTLQPTPAQVTLRCGKCGDALHRDAPPTELSASVASGTVGHHTGSIFGDARSGTVCPKCYAHLPRCAICDLWLGVPDPRSRGALTSNKDPFAEALEKQIIMASAAEGRIPLWLDCDPGHDDAFAILLAVHHPQLHLLGISTVHGNASLDRTTANASRVLQAIGRADIPVYPGTAKPFCREAAAAPNIHGISGLDGTDLLPTASSPPILHTPFLIAMRSALLSFPPGTAHIVATGALTNIALLFASFPDLATHIASLSIMGGALGGDFANAPLGHVAGEGERIGNVSRWAEFNIYCDPEAAAAIFTNEELAAKATLIPLDLTHQVLGTEEVQRLLLFGNSEEGEKPSTLRRMLHDLLVFFAGTYAEVFGLTEGPPLHDPLAVAVLLDDFGFEQLAFDDRAGERWEVNIMTEGQHGKDESVIRQLGRTVVRRVEEKGVRIPRSLNVKAFWQVLEECVQRAEASLERKET